MNPAALSITDLTVDYPLADGSVVTAVSGVNLMVAPGEIHALVGESGAGKTTIGNALMGLLQAPGRVAKGRIEIGGKPVDIRTGRTEGIVQGKDVGAIFQDPMTSLNPLFTVESQLGETMRHHLGLNRAEARQRSLELLRAVGIPEPERRLKSYPHQLSGGQRQRVVIAAALCCDPKLIIADEPTTALDVSVQAQILKLIRGLADERGVGILLVTHNMGVVAEVADRVTIMLKGQVVESGPVAQVLGAPQHPYAKALIGAVPRVDVKLPRLPVPAQESPGTAAAREQVRARMGGGDEAKAGVLSVDNLVVEYGARGGLFGGGSHVFRAVKGVSFTVEPGEIFGLVGESGCGKTTVANTIAGLAKPTSGSVTLGGLPIGAKRGGLARKALQMVFQDPYSALNPRLRVATAIAEPIAFYHLAATKAEAAEDAALLLEAVGLDRAAGARFPHAFSGGQRQRIAIALALATQPRALIADEPTSALDARIARDILDLLDRLRREDGLALLLISHDLPLVGAYAQRLLVLQRGAVVERGETAQVFAAPAQAYTRELIAADRIAPLAAPADAGAPVLVRGEGLRMRYPRASRAALDGVDIELRRGEGLALVGESGSGKSTLGRALLRLLRGAQGRVWFDGVDLASLDAAALRTLRARTGVVFQDPYASLDPRLRVADIVAEPLRIHGLGDPAARRERAAELMRAVGLPEPAMLERYPHQFSGGQRQRIAIARALATRPQLLVCDEAVSALDAHHRAAVLQLLVRLKREHGLALLFVTHDLSAAAAVAERIAVLEGGRIVENGTTAQVLGAPAHAHTRALLAARAAL